MTVRVTVCPGLDRLVAGLELDPVDQGVFCSGQRLRSVLRMGLRASSCGFGSATALESKGRRSRWVSWFRSPQVPPPFSKPRGERFQEAARAPLVPNPSAKGWPLGGSLLVGRELTGTLS